jgi:Melibiase
MRSDHSVRTSQTALTEMKSRSPQRSRLTGGCRSLLLCLAAVLASVFTAQAQELSNDTLRLRLNVTPQGIPIIEEVIWGETGQIAFRDLGTPNGLSDWVPESLIPAAQSAPATWNIRAGEVFKTAEATCNLNRKMRITWIVDLPNQGQLFRLRVRLTNRSKVAQVVDWFPAWSANWDVGGQSQWVRWWKALKYDGVEQALDADGEVRLGSRLQSSDDAAGGVAPYWVVGSPTSRIYFGLQWSGGWSARLDGLGNGLTFAVRLPPAETQLVLSRGESIEGPALLVTPMTAGDETEDRAIWMRARLALAQLLYPGPAPSFPLSYNTWYAVRQQINADFLNRQMAARSPYGFDAFVIDAGWYGSGHWKPDRDKFPAGALTNSLAALKANGVKAGLWSTPQYRPTSEAAATLAIEQPPIASRFFEGYLFDLSQDSFTGYVAHHVGKLRGKYSMGYWKYDQPFFAEQTLAGAMKNVAGFEKALQAVRQANPDLFIENCQSGGRMINEFTLLLSQTSWLKDDNQVGLEHARANISTALGAMQFVFPWAALRFIYNLDQLNPDDDELTRLYCRSAMAGVWGTSTDLSQISQRQQAIILKEIERYRRLNRLKYSCNYDLQLPDEQADVAGVSFYDRRRLNAGVLLYRWQRGGAFDQRIVLPKLKSWATYRILDVDTGTETVAKGDELRSSGLTVPFTGERLSALLFVKQVKSQDQ